MTEVVEVCRDLIRMDTSVPGRVERPAAEYVAGLLADVGLDPVLLESEPGRASVVVRVPGTDPSRPALLVHGHLDVVPAVASDWRFHPFGGEVAEDCLWGRGAVDMKDTVAVVLAVLRERARTGRRPARDVVAAFVADEENGGVRGAQWLVREHPELFDGCTEGVGEVGGFSVDLPGGTRIYPIETAQKAGMYVRLRAIGRAGHGSMLNDRNPVTMLAAAVGRLGGHEFPRRLTATTRVFLAGLARVLEAPDDPDMLISRLGGLGDIVGATLRHTANPTILEAGYKGNVIPGEAVAYADCRLVPGFEDEFLPELVRVVGPDVSVEVLFSNTALETGFDGDLVDAMTSALTSEDPAGVPLPYCLSGGTDAAYFSTLGIRCFGFAPLRLTPGLDYARMFHGVDERVPLSALDFGVRVFDRFLSLA